MHNWHYLTNSRSFLALLHDVCIACLAWILAYLLRFNFEIPPEFLKSVWLNAIWVIPLQILFFINFGLYQGVWRFASLPDLKRILKAIGLSTLAISTFLLMFHPLDIVPRSVLILDPVFLVLMMGGNRLAYRAWKEHRLYGFARLQGKPVLIMGAGEAAIALVKDLQRSKDWQVIGLLDDDISIHGRQLMDIKVLGSINDIAKLANNYAVEHVIVAMPSAMHQQRRHAVNIANQNGLTVLTVPAFDDLISGKLSVSQIRKVEVEDLLGREPVALDNMGLHALIEGHAVLVSGAGGSIGSELCRQILKYKPSKLVCLDISEYALYNLEQELNQQETPVELVYMTGDVKNSQRIKDLLNRYQPAVVFHAAAYKHVPMMENGNVWEALSNNVIGTHTLAMACKEVGIDKFVLISTDKAVNPTNVMGASKRLAEMVCQGLQDQFNSSTTESVTKFVIVRFGNVLGSSGSVIPKFREQIAKGGPVTITHPEITRFFMSIPEAAQLVMQAGLMGKGGDIFVLDMGEPVKIAALAADMIRLSGLQTDDIKIEYVGLRPGEKLYEELLADDEHTLPTPHEKLRIAIARPVDKAWVKRLLKWIENAQSANEVIIKNELTLWVEEYIPQHQSNTETRITLIEKQITLH